MKMIIRFLLLTCMSLALVACNEQEAAVLSNEEVQLAPTVELLNLQNETFNTATVEKPILYSFWASWCNYCKEEIPQINELYAQYGEEVEFVSVNITHNDSLNGAKQFIADRNLTMPTYFDIDGIASTKFGVLAVPTIVLVDRDGAFVERKVGPSNEDDIERITKSLKTVVDGL